MIHPTRSDRGQGVGDDEDEKNDQRSDSDAMPSQTAPINGETENLIKVLQEVDISSNQIKNQQKIATCENDDVLEKEADQMTQQSIAVCEDKTVAESNQREQEQEEMKGDPAMLSSSSLSSSSVCNDKKSQHAEEENKIEQEAETPAKEAKFLDKSFETKEGKSPAQSELA